MPVAPERRTRFRASEAFLVGRRPYRLLPFRFLRRSDGEVLLTNEAGEFVFLATATFQAFSNQTLASDDPAYAELKAQHFLDDTQSMLPLELLATKVRTKRSFLEGFTRLHIFVVTLRCDHSCPYCQVSRVTEDRLRFDMSADTASRALDWVFQSPARELKIEFQGGESTMNWPLITDVVNAASRRAEAEGRLVEFVVATNLCQVNDQILEFAAANGLHFSSSLDGPAVVHNENRPRPGRDSHARFEANLARARSVMGHDRVSALMTTTPAALEDPEGVIDEYVRLGFDCIFLRPISPYGFAVRGKLDHAYDPKRFLEFYRRGLAHIVNLNRNGRPFVEVYAQLLLRKMLTPFPVGYVDLQSPAGAGTGVLVYNYDGNVYASDEGRMLAEMGDHSFRLGNLLTDTYRAVMTGPRVRAIVESSCLESMPGCAECVYVPYCGADPVHNWATQGDIVGYRPTSDFCRRQLGMFELLFDVLRHGDDYTRRLLIAWGMNGQ